MAADPAAFWLRLRQTVVEVAAEKNSTLVMPAPVELLRLIDRASRAPALRTCPGADPQVPDGRSSQDPRRLRASAGLPAGRG
jgi:hypothetical protein